VEMPFLFDRVKKNMLSVMVSDKNITSLNIS